MVPRPHVHRCPECYADAACFYARCDIEPDLALEDGTPCGSFVVCAACSGADPREPLGPASESLEAGW